MKDSKRKWSSHNWLNEEADLAAQSVELRKLAALSVEEKELAAESVERATWLQSC